MSSFDDEETLLLQSLKSSNLQKKSHAHSNDTASLKLALSSALLGAVAALLLSAYVLPKVPHLSTRRDEFVPSDKLLLGSWQHRHHRHHHPESSSKVYHAPKPSEQDWCMAPGSYEFYGTYRSPDDRAEEGLFYAPGRFQGTILTGQDDETVYFHMLNMSYGNLASPHRLPKANQEADMFDVYCTMHPKKESVCYAPKFFPPHSAFNTHTRCASLEFPSMDGFALCRQLAMAEFTRTTSITMGLHDMLVERWTARLSTGGTPANDYDGEIELFMQNATADGKLKVPLTHWLTSDDQTLETSFQIMNRKEWDPPGGLPDIPEGCEKAVNVQRIPNKLLHQSQLLQSSGCPFGALHRHLVLPSLGNYQK